MNLALGPIAKQKKTSAPLIRFAQSVIDGVGILDMATQFLGQIDDLRTQKEAHASELQELQEKKEQLTKAFRIQEVEHAVARETFGPEISRIRAEVHTERVQAKTRIDSIKAQVTEAERKQAAKLSDLAQELLHMETLMQVAVTRYNEFKKEITSHG